MKLDLLPRGITVAATYGCLVCDNPSLPERRGGEAIFCCQAHCREFNNRRQTRGAQMYDLVMALRYERGDSEGVMSDLWELARQYREEDKAIRGGRRSWRTHAEVLAQRPSLRTKAGQIRAGR